MILCFKLGLYNMWKEILETKVIRVEGMVSSQVCCQVLVAGNEVEFLDPYNQDKAFQLPLKSGCQIELKSKTCAERLSVSFNTALIVEDGVHWLPLFKDPGSDFLSRFPDEVRSPRVLMLLHKKVSLDVIQEGGEKSELGSACEEDYMPEIKLCSSFIEEHGDNLFEESYDEGLPSINIGISDDNYTRELKDNLEQLRKLLEIEKKSKESALKELESVKNCFLEEIQDCKKRENELLEEFKNTEAKYVASKFENTKMKHELKSLQNENTRLTNTLHSQDLSTSNQLEELTKKLSVYEQSHSNSDYILTRLAEYTGNTGPEPGTDKLKEREEVIQQLTSELNVLKSKAFNTTRQPGKPDELEEAVQRFVKNHKLPVPILKDKEQAYIFNNKKIFLATKDGALMYRVGAVLKPFEEVLGFHYNEIKQKLTDDESKSRVSPIRKSIKTLGTGTGTKSPRRSFT